MQLAFGSIETLGAPLASGWGYWNDLEYCTFWTMLHSKTHEHIVYVQGETYVYKSIYSLSYTGRTLAHRTKPQRETPACDWGR